MRVTEGMMQEALLRRVQQGYARVAEASNQLSSGQRIARPSDDPMGADTLRRVEREMDRLATRIEKSQTVTQSLTAAEGTLGEASEVLLRAYELCFEMANGTSNASERTAAAEEVRQMKSGLLALANTSSDGAYLFGGRTHDVAPFDEDGIFVGDPEMREVEIAPGLRIEATTAGDVAFAGARPPGVDLFATLDSIAASLDANDPSSLVGLGEKLAAGREQLNVVRAELGARVNLIDRTSTFAERMRDNLSARRRDVGNADVARAAADFAQAQQVLQTALAVAGRITGSGSLSLLG